MPPAQKTLVEIDGHRFTLTNLDKVLYPATGTTKAEVINYYAQIATVMLPLVRGRPVTRKRWPNGVEAEPFFQKNVDAATPTWMPRQRIEHRSGAIDYPLASSPAALAWFGQNGALELHVPQWQFTADGLPGNPDRMVFDLDPGPGVSLADCAQVAFWVRGLLGDIGAEAVPVTSGSKGLHLYVALDGTRSSAEVSAIAQQVARTIEGDHPDLVTSNMSKALRPKRVFIDWSQNNGNKTTVAPYSLRGRPQPTVAAPRSWDELADPELRHLEFSEVLERVADGLDPTAPLGVPTPSSTSVPRTGDGGEQDRLATYRSMRSADRTPEPVPDVGGQPHGADDTFVIQEHHARRLHWDVRLERAGVLVSWAVPRGVPENSGDNRLAVHTEDHPLEYAAFSGTIPHGEYGGGEMTIWDSGTYETEKWWSDEVIVRFHGQKVQGRYVIVRTDGKNWLLRRMKDQQGRWVPHPEPASRRAKIPDSDALTGSRVDGSLVGGSLVAGSLEGGAGPAVVAAPGGATRSPEPAGTEAAETKSAGTDPTGTDPTGAGPTDVSATQADSAPDEADLPSPPTDLAPMLATSGTVDQLVGDDWRFEGKWDGIRALAAIGNGALRLTSRTGRDITTGYPELVELLDLTAGHSVVLDGEIVALDNGGRTDFGLLQQRMGLTRKADVDRVRAKTPVHYYVFDILWLDGVSLLRRGYEIRRRLLTALNPQGEAVEVPEQMAGTAAEALEASDARRWEGIVAKKADAPYRPGQRVHSWIKIKNSRVQEGIVVGWKPGSGRRAGTIGSLLLAIPAGHSSVGGDVDSDGGPDGGLTYIGKVGTGFTDAVLDDLYGRLEPLRSEHSPVTGPVPRPDAKDAVWVQPELVGEVRFGEWTHDGRLRHPSWRGLRPDKRPDEVRRES